MSRLTDHASAALTYGPGMLYSLVTWRQVRACGGVRPWAREGYGCSFPPERETRTPHPARRALGAAAVAGIMRASMTYHAYTDGHADAHCDDTGEPYAQGTGRRGQPLAH